MLCKRCLEAIQELKGCGFRLRDNLFVPHYDNILDLQAAALRGCYACSSLWNSYTAEEKEVLIETKGKWPTKVVIGREGDVPSRIHMTVSFEGTLPFTRIEHAHYFQLSQLSNSCTKSRWLSESTQDFE